MKVFGPKVRPGDPGRDRVPRDPLRSVRPADRLLAIPQLSLDQAHDAQPEEERHLPDQLAHLR